MRKNYVIIVAGGSGSRMNSDLPKQFLLLAGKPVLMHTIERFTRATSNPKIIVVLNESLLNYWKILGKEHHFEIPHAVVKGGNSRFQSVKNGLEKIFQLEADNLEQVGIAIHDGARPLISPNLIDDCFDALYEHQATVVAVQSTNSVRIGSVSESESIDRDSVWMIQTPQTFSAQVLKEAFLQSELASFTDDASVVEKLGYPIHIIPGDHKNIKITFEDDLKIAQLYLQ
ncbi:2-C-methyl-D-erythritol 4-phosphate cytidylyltransferase [Sphingobacterium paludis]|uniref:2-C-methyl-D-erythritol 4-phosphate cytidylyltransferase n=1 Tax=Sphingobacterium paludis TaxID=1476465 RepID=A0A4R7CYN0_9SPHI|nr:2-C-methyl-D-erythritol 4-phosphate cytidylyltransferase [Sphingobacterium paludis]TDS12244.1 2-C-methyl-D-erythritol 4-phosphate cytidylyltransferase [Sphingobacterium paludis]